VSRPVRCGLWSREDNPNLTSWRMKQLIRGKGSPRLNLIAKNLYINSRREASELFIDNEKHLQQIINTVKALELEFIILDVFNTLHVADENDNTEMRRIMARLTRLQAEAGCNIGVIHHFSKADTGSLTSKMRGASAIAGWAEWLIGISKVNE